MLWNKWTLRGFGEAGGRLKCLSVVFSGIVFWGIMLGDCCAEELEQEFVTTTPVLLDGVLYVASSTHPSGYGHLRAIDVLDTIAATLWDAAEQVPFAGTDAAQPETIALENSTRSLFTDIDGFLQPLDAASAAVLQDPLGVDSQAEAEIRLHALRGRRSGTLILPAGSGENPQRLRSFSRSSPLVVGNSGVTSEMANRDRILYIGADDGLLHAFYVSGLNPESGLYLVDDPAGGTELWGYLPGSFLPYLKDPSIIDPDWDLAISLDGTPQVRDFFIDLDGDGLRRWHTLLAVTGTILPDRRSCLVVLDITDPYRPELLWEKLIPGVGTGRTRGLRLGDCDATGAGCLYLSTDSQETDTNGLHVLAVSLERGELLWQFRASYDEHGPVAEATPAVPALADLDGDTKDDVLILGDLLGRLWVLDAATGNAQGNAPVFTTPGGLAEPIGTEVVVMKKTAVFVTGGIEAADLGGEYKLYAVEILPQGGRLLWSYALLPGEKVFGAPRFDSLGNLVLATARNYAPSGTPGEDSTSGRIVVLNKDGEEITSRETGAATVGRGVTAPGVLLSVDLTGEVTQFGTPARLSGLTTGVGSVKILSWRQR